MSRTRNLMDYYQNGDRPPSIGRHFFITIDGERSRPWFFNLWGIKGKAGEQVGERNHIFKVET